MTSTALTADDLQSMNWAQLAARVRELEGFLRTQAQTIREIVDERDAALMLNELCHY